MTRLYRLLGSASEWPPDDPRLVELGRIARAAIADAADSGTRGQPVG